MTNTAIPTALFLPRIMSKSLILTLALLYCFPDTSLGQIRKLSWLKDAQTPPAGEFNLNPLNHWQANLDQIITSRRQWEKPKHVESRSVREVIEKRWLEFLGPLATQPRKLPKLEVLDRQIIGDVERTLVKYEVLPGDFVEAYILKPTQVVGKVPGVVVLHSTVENSIELPAGIDGRPEEFHGLGAAQRGMVAIVPRNYLWPTNYGIQAGEMAADF